MEWGATVFVAYFEPGRLIAFGHGTVIHFHHKPHVRMRSGVKLLDTPRRDPLASVHIGRNLEMFLLFEDKDELISINDIVRDAIATVVEMPLSVVVPDIVNDVTTQLVRHGIIAGIEAQLFKDRLVEV